MRVLVVEDELALRQRLMDQLRDRGYSVDGAADGEEGRFFGEEYPYDLAIIDIGLPKMSGIELIRHLRKQGCVFPILILTARGDWRDKVEGLEAGADDYLVKPFHLEELLARLNALLRRAAGLSCPRVEIGGVCLDTARQAVTVNGNVVDLTAYEYKVLEYLMLNQGRVVSKTELTEHIYQICAKSPVLSGRGWIAQPAQPVLLVSLKNIAIF